MHSSKILVVLLPLLCSAYGYEKTNQEIAREYEDLTNGKQALPSLPF